MSDASDLPSPGPVEAARRQNPMVLLGVAALFLVIGAGLAIVVLSWMSK